MKITYFGQSCFLVDIGGYRLLFDPFIRPNPLAAAIDVESIQADYILVSHAHWDHTADCEEIAARTGAPIVTNWEIHSRYSAGGLKTHPMNLGGKWPFDFGTVAMVPAVHSSSFPDGAYGGSPAGFVVENDEHTFYFAGDTAFFSDMRLIGESFRPSFALLPIGDNFTMGIKDAILAARALGVKKVIGMHYDTFPYIQIDKEEVLAIARFNEIDLLLPGIGETLDF